MAKLTFTTTGCWDNATGFGCASLGLPGLCENHIPMVATYENDLKGTILTGSYEQMLADPKVDLVYIAVPHSHHYQWTIASLNAGKHVLCEKAFAVNEKQAKEMIDLARQKGLLLAEAIWTRYQPARRMIDDLIREGVIGRPEVVTANLDYYITHQERSVEPYLAGGALLDVGVYTLNFAPMVMGNQIRRIVASCVEYESGVDAKDNIFIEYENGGMASLYASMTDRSNRTGCIRLLIA